MSRIRPIHKSRPLFSRSQKGAAFIVMLVIMIMGIAAVLVGAFSKAALQTALNEKNSDRLAQAKEVVIGYALNGTAGSQPPGNLTFPDVLSEATPNYDGVSEGGCLDATKVASTPIAGLPLKSSGSVMRCLGRLPWKTFNMPIASPSENDPTGFMPWYAISANMVDATPFNSELLNSAPHPWLTVRDMKGNVLSNRVAFILIIPGATLSSQSRPLSTSQGGPGLAGANQYLDSITVPASCVSPCVPGTYRNADMDDDFIMGEEHRRIDDPANPGKQIEDPTYNFNDKLIYVTIDELMPLIEKRIAREVKNCLDTYAASSGNKYPWAAPISPLAYTSATNTKFGRIPDVPAITTTTTVPLDPGNTSDPDIQALFNALAAVATARANCLVSNNAANTTAMINAGATLEAIAETVKDKQPTAPAIPSSVTDPAKTAGDKAQQTSPTRCDRVFNGTSVLLEFNLAAANTALGSITTTITAPEDAAMQPTWTAGCFTSGNMADYWTDWQRLVLYQVSDSYRPNGATASCAGTCLNISGSANPNAGSGTYRAAIALAGKKVGTQARLTTPGSAQNVTDYLELNNQNNKTANPSNLTFDTYTPTDSGNYSSVNDLVLCLDGKVNCK